MKQHTIDYIGLYGPTAIGKTALALSMAAHYPIEIISVDSALVYKGMNIGTGKPSKEEQKLCPHHLIDIIDPDQNFTVGQFFQQASELINAIRQRKRIPLLVGGTALYFESLAKGYAQLPVIDENIRQKTHEVYSSKGLLHLHQQLLLWDSRHEVLHPNDTQRIIRAYNVYCQTKTAIYDFWENQTPQLSGQLICMQPSSREALNERILSRLDNMLENGLVEEVRSLIEKYPLTAGHNSMRCVGYKQTWQYLHTEMSLDELREKIFVATRQYAKRQVTWLNRWQEGNMALVQEKQAKYALAKAFEDMK